MLGHRGVRMGISFPEIYETQIRSICEATADLTRENIAARTANNGAAGRSGRGA